MFLPPLNMVASMEITKSEKMLNTLKHMSFEDIDILFKNIDNVENIIVEPCEVKNRECKLVLSITYQGITTIINQKFYKSTGTSRVFNQLEGVWLPFEQYNALEKRIEKPEDRIIINLLNNQYSEKDIEVMYTDILFFGRYLNLSNALAGKYLTSM
jgi:hypothetical protein